MCCLSIIILPCSIKPLASATSPGCLRCMSRLMIARSHLATWRVDWSDRITKCGWQSTAHRKVRSARPACSDDVDVTVSRAFRSILCVTGSLRQRRRTSPFSCSGATNQPMVHLQQSPYKSRIPMLTTEHRTLAIAVKPNICQPRKPPRSAEMTHIRTHS